MNERTPAEVFPPSEFIRDEIAARGWTEAEFRERIGDSASAILAGRMTPDDAARIGKVFGTSAELWMNLAATWEKRDA